jgi:uncharacterized coiled-coil DUF342 family protein
MDDWVWRGLTAATVEQQLIEARAETDALKERLEKLHSDQDLSGMRAEIDRHRRELTETSAKLEDTDAFVKTVKAELGGLLLELQGQRAEDGE